ncbi:hypothetical protein CLAFUW4_05597, partial [Fulvia fulva]
MAPILDIAASLAATIGLLGGDASITVPATATGIATADITTHGPYEGTATTTGAEHASTTLSATISPLPKTATYYNYNGKLQEPEVIPYQPWGGKGYDKTPVYQVESDHDF